MERTTLRNRFRLRTRIIPYGVPAEEQAVTERIVARLIARAYAANHPELFGTKSFRLRTGKLSEPRQPRGTDHETSGPLSSAGVEGLSSEERTGVGGMA